jgi:hypothetical protein
MSSESFLVSSFLRGRGFEVLRFRGCMRRDIWLIQKTDVLAGSSYRAEIMGMETSQYSH